MERSDGEVVAEYLDFSVAGDRSGNALELKSRDHLTIREIPDWSPIDSVEVEGEVRFPGVYRIRKGETLSDIVLRAGGFTENASPESAIFIRKSIAKLEVERAAQFAREIQNSFATRLLTEETTKQNMEEISQIVSTLKSVEGAGRLFIDLRAAMAGNVDANLELENEDRLVIPVLSNTVSVVGEVKRQGTHSFQTEFVLNDYVDLSAGYTQRADEEGVGIVKANCSVVTLTRSMWRFADDNFSIDPGDTIVVPINTQYKVLASWREITQIIYQSMVSIAVLARL